MKILKLKGCVASFTSLGVCRGGYKEGGFKQFLIKC